MRIHSSVAALLVLSVAFSCQTAQPEEKPEEQVPAVVEVSSVSLAQASAEMYIGETVQLTATVLPADATDKTVTWTSSKQSVARVSDTGLVTALEEGESTVTASAGGKSATCSVTVSCKPVAVSGITLSSPELTLIVGEEATLTATVLPEDASDKSVQWTSSNEAVAKVLDGVVSARSAGSATIIAKAGGQSATCKVTVSEKYIAVESIELDRLELQLEEGESATLSAAVKPDNATDKTVGWSSSDPAVASVQNGLVTALKAGTAIITARAGDKTATCSVTVKEKYIVVESVELSKSELSLELGGSATLTATVKPDNATDKTVGWSSSDPAVASVQNGLVTALMAGTAVIMARAGDKTATCKVTVKEKDAEGGNEDIGYDDWN